MTNLTEFQAIQRAIRASNTNFKDQVVVVFMKEKDSYSYCSESEYTGWDMSICGKYLNGCLIKQE